MLRIIGTICVLIYLAAGIALCTVIQKALDGDPAYARPSGERQISTDYSGSWRGKQRRALKRGATAVTKADCIGRELYIEGQGRVVECVLLEIGPVDLHYAVHGGTTAVSAKVHQRFLLADHLMDRGTLYFANVTWDRHRDGTWHHRVYAYSHHDVGTGGIS